LTDYKINKHSFLLKNNSNNRGSKSLFSFAFQYEDLDLRNPLSQLKNNLIQYFYTSTPELKIKFLGIDSLISINENGNERVKDTSVKIRELNLSHKNNFDQFNLGSIPLFLGGMKFSPGDKNQLWNDYSDSDWFIPKFLLYHTNGANFIVYNFYSEIITDADFNLYDIELKKYLESSPVNNTAPVCEVIKSNYNDPLEKNKWITNVTSALSQIENKKFHKIVLSRQVDLELSCTPDFSKISEQLEKEFPKCYIFLYRKNSSTFFGASPEKLAKISNGWVEADALAGSARRGKDIEEDEKLAEELLSSKKNLNEQRAVVEFISHSFEGFSEEIIFANQPIIRKLPNIQHLWTPIKAKLKGNKSILSILKDIHPTPAICGVPWTNALVSIKEMETHSRGLFAGMIGWFNFENEGEFAVAIRSALAKSNKIYALAGCGIVEGSDPEQEFREAELKLKPILSLFKNEEIYKY